MRLLTLPNELLVEVARSLGPRDLKSLIKLLPNHDNLLIPCFESAVQKEQRISCLIWATKRRYRGLVSRILDYGVDVNAKDGRGLTALHWAATRGQVSVLKLLVDHGCDVNIVARGDTGTAFYCAAREGHVSALKFFLEAGVDINQKSKFYSFTALYFAAKYGRSAAVMFLLENNAEVHTRDMQGLRGSQSIQRWLEDKALKTL